MATRAEVRSSIAAYMRDYYLLTATSNGSDSTFNDYVHLVDVNNSYAGSWLRVVSSTQVANVGEMRRVISSSAQNGNLTFDPPLPLPTLVGDVVELFNLYGNGFAPEMYDIAIADTISSSFPEHLTLVSLDAVTMDSNGEIDVPATWYFIYDVRYECETGYWEGVIPAHMEADIPRNKIRLRSSTRDKLDNALQIRLYGAVAPVRPTVDSDEIGLPFEWMKYQTAANLARLRTGHREWLDAGRDWQNMANALRGTIRKTPMPLTRVRW